MRVRRSCLVPALVILARCTIGSMVRRGALSPCFYLLVSFFLPNAAVTPDEVKALYAQFVSLKGEDMGSSTGLNITAAEFQAALGFRDGGSVFLQRIFQLFDGNGDGVVNFEEFMHSIAVLTPTAAPEARLECECALASPDIAATRGT